MNTKATITSHELNPWLDLNRWLNIVTVATAVFYTLIFFVSTYFARSAGHLEWALPDNPRAMITLCWVSAAINLCFMHELGKVVAAVSLSGMILFFLRWADVTTHIKLNLGVAAIPKATSLENLFVGAGWPDVIALVVGILILILDLWLLVRNHRLRRQSASGVVATQGSMAFPK